jgi:DNA-binding response OmpR family regulator
MLTFASMEAALPAIESDAPAVLVADIGLPGMSGIEGSDDYCLGRKVTYWSKSALHSKT